MLTLSDAARLVWTRQISPVELTEACLRRIDEVNPRLNAFVTVRADAALAEARQSEGDLARGQLKGPLHGIPLALKDNVDTAGVRTTAASGVFKNNVPREDSEVVRRLKAAGAVILGKLNLHECAYGGSSVISLFGPVRNPWDSAYSTGGSSGGSAAAVAGGLCCGAIGTDTGGSIRQPAAFCGVVGLKPSYGLVSNRGVMPLTSSMDHVGPLTRSVHDAALMLLAIAGYDPQDTTSANLPVHDYVSPLAAGRFTPRIGIPRDFFYDALHPDVQSAMERALAVLADLGASQREIGSLDADVQYSSIQRAYAAILAVEAYSCQREWIATTPELYQAETLKRLQGGASIDRALYRDSRRVLDRLRHTIGGVFECGGSLDHADRAGTSVRHRGPAGRSEYPSEQGSRYAAQHTSLQPAWPSKHLNPMRLHARRIADRDANHRADRRRGRYSAPRSFVRAGDCLAYSLSDHSVAARTTACFAACCIARRAALRETSRRNNWTMVVDMEP